MKYIRAVFSPAEPLRLQAYAGAAWRGAFGHALKKTVCVAGLRPCSGCPMASLCLFPLLFPAEPRSNEGPARFATPPPPFVLAPDPTPRKGFLAPEERIEVRLLLLGQAAANAPYLLHALIEAARGGIGRSRTPLRPVGLGQAGGPLLAPDTAGFAAALAPFSPKAPPLPSSLALRFLTPLRLRVENDLLTAKTFTPRHLVTAALRRTRLLLGWPEEPLAAALRQASAALSWQAPRFGWLETAHRSTRQGSLMRFGGIVGESGLALSGLPEEMKELLWLASLLHVGKGASMGFGRIALEGGGPRESGAG